MRFFRLSPALSLLAAMVALASGAVRAEPLAFKRIWVDYRTENQFERIGEYLTGKEQKSDGLVLRTDPTTRAGQYWLARVQNPGAPVQAKVELQVIGSDSAQVMTFDQFAPVDLQSGEQVLHIGLTGGLWQKETQRPVAWQLRLLAPDGAVLAREASFLW